MEHGISEYYITKNECTPHHAQSGLKILVIVTTKEGLAGTTPGMPSFRMTPGMIYNVWRQQGKSHTDYKM